MKNLIAVFGFILVSQIIHAQKPVVLDYSPTDKKMLQIPDSLTKTTKDIANYIVANFKTDGEKVRAIFIWTASAIEYDYQNMFAINFYEKKEDKIAKPLKTRKGICENYAAVFNDICSKSGLRSYIIEGYTKQNGFADYIPHAWCAAFVDSSWYMFDPTWGSGYISNGKFVKKINNSYFKLFPSTLIKSHMPFDFMWEFLNYPITNQEFYEGKTKENKTKPFYNFDDSIKVYEVQNNVEQLKASAERIERNGTKNSLIYDRLQHIKMALENARIESENQKQAQNINIYNAAVADYNDGINKFNEFIQFKNKQFTPAKTDPEIQSMIDGAEYLVNRSKTKLNDITNPDDNATTMISQLTRSIDDASKQIKPQKDWLKSYFSKGKASRKSMFYERVGF